jgi:hypothetical protein
VFAEARLAADSKDGDRELLELASVVLRDGMKRISIAFRMLTRPSGALEEEEISGRCWHGIS